MNLQQLNIKHGLENGWQHQVEMTDKFFNHLESKTYEKLKKLYLLFKDLSADLDYRNIIFEQNMKCFYESDRDRMSYKFYLKSPFEGIKWFYLDDPKYKLSKQKKYTLYIAQDSGHWGICLNWGKHISKKTYDDNEWFHTYENPLMMTNCFKAVIELIEYIQWHRSLENKLVKDEIKKKVNKI